MVDLAGGSLGASSSSGPLHRAVQHREPADGYRHGDEPGRSHRDGYCDDYALSADHGECDSGQRQSLWRGNATVFGDRLQCNEYYGDLDCIRRRQHQLIRTVYRACDDYEPADRDDHTHGDQPGERFRVSASATVTLYPPIAVNVTPMTASAYANGTIQLLANVTNTSNTGVTWTLSGAGSISSSGLYTAPASVTSQQAVTITATSLYAIASVSSSATITLYPPITVAVGPATATLYPSATQQFSATVSNTSNTAVTWTVSGPGSIDSTGLYAAPATITSQQTVTVTATGQADTSVSGGATVTLLPPVAVSVTPATATLSANQTQAFTATVINTGNTAVTWTISPLGTGSISAAGAYTAPAAISSAQTVTVYGDQLG